LLILCVVGLIGVAGYRAIRPGTTTASDDIAETVEQERETSAKLIGRALRPLLDPGSRILIVGDPVPGDIEHAQAMFAWKKGLTEGLKDETWKEAGYGPTHGLRQPILSEQFAGYLEELQGQIDAVVSFAWLPEDLAQLAVVQDPKRPKIGAFFFYTGAPAHDVSLIQTWLENGYVDVVVLQTKENKLVTYTP